MTTIIRAWSGPRNLSTALMRSWGSRADTAVMDEPLYAHFLDQTGLDHPGASEIIEAGPADLAEAVALCQRPALGAAQTISYQKHMAHHLLPDMDLRWVDDAVNVLVLRHPRRVIASYARVRELPTLQDLGFPQLVALRERFPESVVIEADQFLADPEVGLRRLCSHAGVTFDPAMMSWETGIRPTDGVWSRYWYDAVEHSTGFVKAPTTDPASLELPEPLETLAADALDLYTVLQEP